MEFDIIIAGGGLVGASFAASLKESGLNLAIVDPKAAIFGEEGWDSRIYAISPGSARFLEQSGIWQKLDKSRITQVSAMKVFGDDGKSTLNFDAMESGLPEMAFIAESRNLLCAMHSVLSEQSSVKIFSPAQCRSMRWEEDAVALELEDISLRAKLLVGADGANSWVRREAGFETAPRPYRQTAIVANFLAERPHENIAWQWFKKDGIVALLPLPGNRVSLVWSAWEEHAEDLLRAADFCAKVEEASNHALGKLELITPPEGFPLRLLRLDSLVKPRIALIGDAAHNTHPLAGQGVNLGFRDASQLAEVLQSRGAGDCGEYSLLRRYDRARKEDILAMQLTTDFLQKFFNNSIPGLSSLRNLGLRLLDSRPFVKNILAQHALL